MKFKPIFSFWKPLKFVPAQVTQSYWRRPPIISTPIWKQKNGDERLGSKFSYSKKAVIVNKNPKIKKILKELKRPLTVLEVSDLRRGGAKGSKFAASTDYPNGKILINRDMKMSDEDKQRLVAHEAGHFKLREKKVNKFSKTVQDAVKRLKLYSYLKKTYPSNRISEEAFAYYYENLKTKPLEERKEWLIKYYKKHPVLAKEFSKLAK